MLQRKTNLKIQILWIILTLVIYGGVQLLIMTNVINMYYQITLITIGINIILAVGLNLIIGIAGQFSLGHAGFMSIGAYACAIVTMRMPTLLGFALGILVGIVVAGIASLLIAIPTLRLKGDYLAIATLGFSEIIRIVMVNGGDLTNGAAGLSGIPVFTSWPLLFIGIVIVILIIVNYVRSSPGRATKAICEDEIASESVGINTTKYKTIAFVIGAMSASLAGAFYASYFTVIKPENFGFMKSLDILIIVVFGGIGSITGTIIAAILLGIINIFLQSYGVLRMILYGVILIVIMIFRPGGLLGKKEFRLSAVYDFFNRKLRRREEQS
ncbi:branched-chain amino acid ABC transporter permease [Culicoidibacter larvae]|uniref:Branched-chain amino acid ABC transporter permease n=1 Tax=Culicoidibacter larvae TaxID=2579976 RepID=A0A5R8QHD6_9FIRM|nr:branched-chain amino acid ABC transporter permease [Culicoidibacter larvae]TLG77146.1 branched-chain amino acid ABC transporter permease [Culicoidibacter larvae]